ncbi:MAG: hypothetical protein A3E87_08670 [Gammaproteobacteria bacterium RIFCSPHIGHO2_12_FULL_35_23]|nr:MAG: hypothetical protein A3E87_08670 [Gammaproteobacteria bacterium RIFCSPHIGHO2_12_FULL_35_23]
MPSFDKLLTSLFTDPPKTLDDLKTLSSKQHSLIDKLKIVLGDKTKHAELVERLKYYRLSVLFKLTTAMPALLELFNRAEYDAVWTERLSYLPSYECDESIKVSAFTRLIGKYLAFHVLKWFQMKRISEGAAIRLIDETKARGIRVDLFLVTERENLCPLDASSVLARYPLSEHKI